ncbi:formyltetrahydrofolate deformylase [Glutamicibacter creatinolyticus]|uniref:formyltetrahydrofolate deformylase n=1 Tax=Glutamicibacter creatinolyticus TaxID=162496 RepID=UPI0031D3C209
MSLIDLPASHPAAHAARTEETSHDFVFTASCRDRVGIIHAVSQFLAGRGLNIREHQQFDDTVNAKVHLRTAFHSDTPLRAAQLREQFQPVAERFNMGFQIRDSKPTRTLLMVSKSGHCLNDLIFRWRTGTLNAQIPLVVSNHEDLRPMAEAAGIPYLHLPVNAGNRAAAEARLLELIQEHRIELVVLARYMQIFSDELAAGLQGRVINIHHSFLPGFKGARPYHQAHARGVKLIGATAHYVTADLDEGPIIEQEVIRVDHSHDPRALAQAGQGAECQALSRAVQWHCEHRVLLEGSGTIVFR